MKRCFIFFFIVSKLITSCGDSDASKAKPASAVKTYTEMVIEQSKSNQKVEPAILKFMHRKSEENTKKHIDSLIKVGKLSEESFIDYPSLGARFTGYPYMLQVDDSSSYTTIVECTYFENKLYTVNLMPYGDYDEKNITNFLKNQYGKPVHVSEYGYNNKKYHWLKNNYEISYSASALGVISFTDLELMLQDLKQREDLKKLKQDLDKEASLETKKDFQ